MNVVFNDFVYSIKYFVQLKEYHHLFHLRCRKCLKIKLLLILKQESAQFKLLSSFKLALS